MQTTVLGSIAVLKMWYSNDISQKSSLTLNYPRVISKESYNTDACTLQSLLM